MQELKMDDLANISGASGGDFAMGVGISWASTVAGGALGLMKGGLKGLAIGGPAGFAVGVIASGAFLAATYYREEEKIREPAN